MSYTQRLTYEDNNKTLAGCLKPTRMTTIVWQLLKTSKYLYDNKSLYNLLTKVNPIFSRLFSCFLIFSRDFAYVSHAGRESSRYCGSLLKFRMIELLPTPEVEVGFVKRDEVLEATRKKVGQHGRVGADCGLHPLMHTFLKFNLVQDIESCQGKGFGVNLTPFPLGSLGGKKGNRILEKAETTIPLVSLATS